MQDRRRSRPTSGRGTARHTAAVEAMEGRTLLSGGASAVFHLAKAPKLSAKFAKATSSPVAVVVGGPWATLPIQPLAGATPPFSPAQIRAFYGVDTLAAAGTGDGAGQTVAIVDAYYSPNALGDLNTFSSAFGLPTMASGSVTTTGSDVFTAVGQTGGSLPTATNSGWYGETALDVQWVHAIAPRANILLVEAASNSNSDLYAGINYARSVAAVSVVTMSFGSPEYSGQTSTYDGYFTTPAGHQGVTFLASTGDNAASGTVYPGLSSNVVGVGGTTIAFATSSVSYGSEKAWNLGGGKVSGFESVPTYQGASGANLGYAHRAAPDVSFEADANTGVYVYNTVDGGYQQVGGTSLSSPCWAGLIAIADQQRVSAGLTTYDGATQTLPRLYSIYKSSTYATDFHDVTTGSNGNLAGTGYDLATGLGTPVANKLVPDLAGVTVTPTTGTITGRVFQDNNGNNVLDGTDAALAGAVVYLDANNDGLRQSTEPTATTTSTGTYTFASVAVGSTGTVRLLSSPLAGGVPVATPTYSVAAGATVTANVGLFPTIYADASDGDAWTLQNAAANGLTLQVLKNGAVAYTVANRLLTSLTFNFNGVGQSLTVDGTNGTPVPTGGVTLNVPASYYNATLTVLGGGGNDSFVATATQVLFGVAGGAARPITFANLTNLTIDPRGGTDALNASAGTVTVPAGTTGAVLPRTFSTLAVGAGATLDVAPAATHAGRAVLVVPVAGLAVAVGGTLDVADNDLVVQSGDPASVAAVIAGGGGLVSSAAAANPAHMTTLGVAAAGDLGLTTFDGVAVAAGDVLVKYTYFGDANLDGVVNGLDYGRADVGYANALTGWANGDFNGDAAIDGSDYTLIDNAFNSQTAPL